MKHTLLILFAVFLLPSSLLAEETTRTEEKLDALLVYGKGFVFSVKEPSGWVGDIENARKYYANIIFYPATQKYETAQTIIRVLIVNKVDDNTQDDLLHDMKEYRNRYPAIEFKDFNVTHPTYRIFHKLFTVPGQFYEYVAYINPGPQKKHIFSVSMNKQKKEATSSELGVYQKIIASLQLL